MTKAILSVAVLAVVLLAFPVAASGGGAEVDAKQDGGTSEIALEDARPGTVIPSPAAPAWVFECEWDQWTAELVEALVEAGQSANADAYLIHHPDEDSDEWGVVWCPLGVDTGGAFPVGLRYIWPLTRRPPQVVLDWIVAQAYASVEVPVQVGWAAPFGDDDAPFITQFPTWLWVEPEVWSPRQATTSPPVFGITATVTVTPVNVTFTGAEGEVINCGPNWAPIYNFNVKEEDQHSDCTLTYHHSSAVGEWTLSSTITWQATYTCSAFCGPGTLPPFTITNTRPVTVAELQAVLVAPSQ